MQSSDAVNALISPWVARQLSSLAVISECLHQLHLSKPWSRKIEDDMEINDSTMRNTYKALFKDWIPVLGLIFEGYKVYQHADPSDGKFNYPVHRRRNKQNIATLRKDEANLDAFWNVIDQHYKSRSIGTSQHDLVSHLFRSDCAIRRTPEWAEPNDESPTPSKKDEYIYQPFSTTFHDPTKQITGPSNHASLSTKPPKQKTRGTPAPHPPSTQTQPQPQPSTIPHTSTQPPHTFILDKHAHKVFRTLFHSPHNPDTPGEIPWTDFLHAMVSVGFAAEKLHGSAWNFVPRALGVGIERSIQFHEPHPSSKIPFLWARRYGRRLGRAYGWNGECVSVGMNWRQWGRSVSGFGCASYRL